MCSKTASLMRWHDGKKKKDDTMRHPVDGAAWESFDKEFPEFASDPRNVRLGLASDGFQPFANSKTPYSIWPVVLMPYNLPPYLCMQQSNILLSMLIPGPKGPGDAIDIYLQPLIEELKDLWDTCVETFDAATQHHFNLRAALMWTINDFPAYAMLSGWSTKGYLACPRCLKDTRSMRLSHGGKECYMKHRCYFPKNHRWRKDKDSFDGKVEHGLPPEPCSIDEILRQLEDLENIVLSKDPHVKTKINHELRGDNWNKKSIFFELPYWRKHLLRHNLDVMHIEKNICDSVLGTIMNIKGKTKDTIKSRHDLEAMGIRPTLHPVKGGDKYKMPPAPFTFSPAEKKRFCLKSHDCHVILEHLLPLAIRGLLTPLVREALIELSRYFTLLCAKVLKVSELKQLETQIPITLCKLEKVFPPSFFDVMMHLPIHLANEAMIGGPVQFRWMYPIEQYMYKLKSYVRNRAHPEASIAEGYLADECMTLCSSHPGRGLGALTVISVPKREMHQAHDYILMNCDEVQPFLQEYSETHPIDDSGIIEEEWSENFRKWFKDEVVLLYENNKSKEMENLLSLSRGPTEYVTSFSRYVVNGYRFHTQNRDKNLRTQNSGVVVLGNTGDGDENMDYYGVVTEIVEIQYLGGNRIVLFRCNWWDVFDKVRGIKEDEYGTISINCNRQLKTDEPFILASQARQAFYATDNINKVWVIASNTQPRNLLDDDSDVDEQSEAYQQTEFDRPTYVASSSTSESSEIRRSRAGIDPIIVEDISIKSGEQQARVKRRREE
ncbi:uncharacterized protein [Spinacia oleracea]|uniref:DUF4218 domain-containing protein n=1 Tax=Spinacia oleracea TaxID=3562 RepID=A0A9R0JDF2_SPIOL|nr:uncharacterized protein LOC110804520 [Spinacia oleracea]